MKAILLGLALLLLSVSGAAAIDCKKASTDTEVAICNSPDAVAADDALNAAYKAALKLASAADAKALKADQRFWHENLAIDCAYDENGNDAKPEAVTPCLIEEMVTRTKFLPGQPAAGPGAPEQMVPVVGVGADDMYNHTVRFLHPKGEGEKAFNLEIDAALETIHLAGTADDVSDSLDVTLTYASPTLLSARVEMAYLGPQYAHAMPSVYGINIDLTTGKKLTIEDGFDTAAVAGFVKICEAQLVDYISASEDGADQRKANVDYMASDLSNWHFGAAGATAEYLDYFLETPATCELGYDVLRPVVKDDFPLPD